MSILFNSIRAQETSPQTSDLPSPTWRIRLPDGSAYGPIELGELQTWSEECRIAPGDQVSSDNVNWVNAETLPELAMQWTVEMASGEIFGPVHLHAVIDFVHSRLVIPNSRLVNRATGETATVADLVLPLLPDAARDAFLAGAPVAAEDVTSSVVDQVEQEHDPDRLPSDQHKEQLQLRIKQLQATVDESRLRIEQLQGDLDFQQAQARSFRDDKAALEKTYLVKLGEAQKNYDVTVKALEKAEAQVQALRDDQVRREKELVARNSSFSGQTGDISGQIAEKNNVISRLEAELIKTRKDFEAGARDFRDRLVRTTSDYDSTLNNLREKESSLSTAVRELEQARQETRDSNQTLAARGKEVAGQRERIKLMMGEHLQKETQLHQKLETVQGELTRRAAELKGMSERVIDMENSVTAASTEAKQQKVRCQELQEKLDQAEKEAADNRDLFEHILMAELVRRDAELSQEEAAFQAVQAAFSHKQQSHFKQIADIQKYIKGDLSDCRESYLRRQKTLENAAELEAELERRNSLNINAQTMVKQVEQQYLSQIDELRKINQDLTDAQNHSRQELEQQCAASAELQERACQAERALTQRLEKAQEESRDLRLKMGATVTRTESLDKEQQDIRNVICRKDEEFRQLKEANDREVEQGKKREAEWSSRIRELEKQYRATVECAGQTDSEFKRREMLWVTEKARLDQEHTALRQRLSESEKVLEAIRVELRERELSYQVALKESQDGIDEMMRKAQAADMERDKIRQDFDQLRSLFQERQSADKERDREITELQQSNAVLEDLHRQEEARFQEALERQKREVETKVALVSAKDMELRELKQTLNGETETRQAVMDKLVRMEKAFAEAQNTTQQLKDKMAQDQVAARDFRERTQLEHNELNQRLDAILMERSKVESRLASAEEALEERKILLEDEKRQAASREEEWQQQVEQGRLECETLSKRLEQALNDLEQSHLECANLSKRLEQASNDLEQTSQMHEESIKDARLKMEELQRTTVQLQQEYQSVSMRFEQQKKFYEEERGLRRQKEQELHQQRKNCQEVEGSLRQKEQVIIQQRRQFDEELSKIRQREGSMVRRAEHVQQDGRTSVVKPAAPAPAASLPVAEREPLTASVPTHCVTSPELIAPPHQSHANLLARADRNLSSVDVESGTKGLPTREPPSDKGIRVPVEPVSCPEAHAVGDALPSVDPEGMGESARPEKLSKALSKRETKLSSADIKIHNIIS